MFFNVNGLRYHAQVSGAEAGSPLVLLHGFTGCTENWQPLLEHLPHNLRVIRVDLPGHGHTDAPASANRYAMPEVARDLAAIFGNLKLRGVTLWGYSMGGRLALYFALNHPGYLSRLILESASPGLATDAERQQRAQQDNELADYILREGVAAFVDRWEALPLFASQRRLPAEARQRLREQRLRNSATGLAGSLRGMGTGVQPSLWDHLPGLDLPVNLLAGALDAKFVGIAQQMQALLPRATLHIIESAGHAVHLEAPSVGQWVLALPPG